MFRRASSALSLVRDLYGKNVARVTLRSLSEAPEAASSTAASSAARASASSTASTSENVSKLFEKAKFPEPPPAQAEAGSNAAAAVSKFFRVLSNGVFYSVLAGTAFVGYYTYAYETDQLQHIVEETKKSANSFPGSSVWVQLMEYYLEKRRYFEDTVKDYAEPPSDKLLPDLPPQISRHMRTLVLDLDEVLIHAEWTRQRGWRTFKRPGAEEFIKHLAPYYELVVYTSKSFGYADPILDRIDPQRMITYRLYRNSTLYKDGIHYRDLSKLNRDLSKVMFISAADDAYTMQPENTLKVRKWDMEPSDTTLLDLLPFLEAVVRTQVPDVRDVVRSYDGLDIPTAFKERMQRVQELQREKQTTGKSFLRSFAK